MLDLSDDAITAWAEAFPSEGGRVPGPATDGTALDGSAATALARLGSLLDASAREGTNSLVARLGEPATLALLRSVLADAGTRPALRILAWLADELPGGVVVSTDLLDGDPDLALGGLLAESERSALLHRLYGPDRLRALEEACRTALAVSEAA